MTGVGRARSNALPPRTAALTVPSPGLKTAKELDLNIPQSVMQRADDVIR